MAWNQPGNNGQDRDPWGSSNNQGGNSGGNGNKGGREQGPPDLDDIFRKLSKKLGGLGGGKGSGSGGNSTQSPRPPMGGRVVGIVAAAVVIIWAASGFYTIKEAERGVVTRFGKFSHLVEPGLNWKPTFIDDVTAVNVESVRELAASGVMLTSDENVVRVEMNIQYRVTDPERYLFSVTSADDSLRQATDSALRGVIGKYTMDRILTEGRTVIRSDTQRELEETIRPYNMGITLLDVNFQAARPPEEVKAAFDDAIAARENEQQYIREAEAYTNEVQPRANGQAQRILEEARAYKTQTILEAQGEVARFAKILPEYKAEQEITRERLYIETMEKVLSHTRKVLVNDNKGGNLMVLPLDQMLKGGSAPAAKEVIFLSADAFGVLPPVSILTEAQTQYYFLSGFTAKLAGTERGITEPTPTFSACFGQAFLELHPTKYAAELVKKMEKSGAKAYLVNTGWNGTGKRISIKDTRGIIDAILNGDILNAPTKKIPFFDFEVPTELNGVDTGILDPRDTYADASEWEVKAKDLAGRFIKNFAKYEGNAAGKALVAAGPQL